MSTTHHLLQLSLSSIPPVMRRSRHVLILVQDENDHFVLGSKSFYPTGISRLLGGGVEGDEDTTLAAARELEEELGVSASPSELQPLSVIDAVITAPLEPQPINFQSSVYYIKLNSRQIKAGSDVDQLVFLSTTEYQALIEQLNHLSTEISPTSGFAWSDWGQLYGQIHQLALQDLTK